MLSADFQRYLTLAIRSAFVGKIQRTFTKQQNKTFCDYFHEKKLYESELDFAACYRYVSIEFHSRML